MLSYLKRLIDAFHGRPTTLTHTCEMRPDETPEEFEIRAEAETRAYFMQQYGIVV